MGIGGGGEQRGGAITGKGRIIFSLSGVLFDTEQAGIFFFYGFGECMVGILILQIGGSVHGGNAGDSSVHAGFHGDDGKGQDRQGGSIHLTLFISRVT